MPGGVVDVGADDDSDCVHIKTEPAKTEPAAAAKTKAKTRVALKASDLRNFAKQEGWKEIKVKTLPNVQMLSFKRHECRLNFWLIRGTVASYLEHPEDGKGRRRLFP
jgi:hypothetical protein